MGVFATIRSRLGAAWTSARPVGSSAWLPVTVREPYTGAWQRNEEIQVDTALSNPTVFRCVSLIAGDIAKTPLRLVALDANGIWTETTSAAFSPVLRTPNRYQTIGHFLEQWMLSKLLYGNTYVLKDRDARGVVVALYVLDPGRVIPLVAPDGSVYYQLHPNDLAGVPQEILAVPAREIIHDRWNCAFHPLVGLSPLYACGAAALEANTIQSSSTEFFSKGGRPSGLLVAPTEIDTKSAERISTIWHSLGPGKTAVVGMGMKYQDIGTSAVDSQLTEQRDATVATIAGCFGVPISYVDSSKQPPYANSEATQTQYLSQCVQVHMTGIETSLDAGLELPAPYGTEFDIDVLIWMETATKTKAAHDAISAGAMSPNEARFKYFGLGPVPGGDTPYLQQQMFSLAALAQRDASDPFAKPAPAPPAAPAEPTDEEIAATVGDLAGDAMSAVLWSYYYNTTLVAPPPASRIFLNAAHPYTAVTKAWISEQRADGVTVKATLLLIPAGATLHLQDHQYADRWVQCLTTGSVIDQGAYVEVPIAWDSNGLNLYNGPIVEVLVIAPIDLPTPTPETEPTTPTIPYEFSRVTIAVPLVSLTEAKTHLHLTGTAMDADVTAKLEAAQELVITKMGLAADPAWTEATIPRAPRHAILILLDAFYERRGGAEGSEELRKALESVDLLLGHYRDPTVA